jgi:hypothetical protein
MSRTITIPATRFTRTIQIAVSRKAASVTITSKQGNEPAFCWSLTLAPFTFNGRYHTETGYVAYDHGRHWMLVRSKAA